MAEFTHFDQAGQAHMVNVATKPATMRLATASGRVRMNRTTASMIKQGQAGKGDVLGVARLAGIMAAKRTSELIPLCHGLNLASVEIDFAWDSESDPSDRANHANHATEFEFLVIRATCSLVGPTGVEMEAMTAVALAALTIYDMCKSADRSMVIGEIHLTHKSGGKSGEFNAV